MIKMVLSGLKRLEIKNFDPVTAILEKNEIVAEVLSCAICRTDAKMWEQGHRDLVFPRVLGHEMVVRDQDGQRFAVWPGKSCGHCRHCLDHRENLCEKMLITGFHTDGGFAHRIILSRQSLVPIPEDLDTHAACFAEPVGCVVNAFEKLPIKPGSKILIFGAGTMGLITALYAKSIGLLPLIIEKHENKILGVSRFLKTCNIACVKETLDSEFDIVINACPDYIALCQAVTKVDKGGYICFFSGITKNENIETNAMNLIHYKEAVMAGAYGMKRSDVEKAIPFILNHQSQLGLLIQEVVCPTDAPELMPKVLSGQYLKFILDFSNKKISETNSALPGPKLQDQTGKNLVPERTGPDDLPKESLCRKIIQAITPLSDSLGADAVAKIDDKSKPLGALGRIEDLCIQMSLIQNSLNPSITRKNIFVFAGDHGITQEGVSAFPSEVTGQMVENFLKGGAAINVLCRHHNIELKVVDMGVIKDFSPHPDLIIAKVARGTKNFAIQDAMTRDQMIQALETGMNVFFTAHELDPIHILGLGEMGIGNTTSAAAIISAVTGISPDQATGRGTGVDNKGLEHKTKVITRALNFHKPDPGNGFEILSKVGGFEIAAIAGAVLAAASRSCPVVLDGVISTAAGLVAHVINPDIQGYLIAGHKSVETAQKAALEHMGLVPVIDFNMRLGEGTGAALAIDMADAACKIMTQMASFDEARISRSPGR